LPAVLTAGARARARRRWWLACALSCGGLSCGSSSTPGETAAVPGQPGGGAAALESGAATGDPDGGSCWMQSRGAACVSCMASRCGAACDACSASSDCASLASCRDACGREYHNCVPLCKSDFQAGAQAYSALQDCMGQKCEIECDMVNCQQLFPATPSCSQCAAQSCMDKCLKYRDDPQASEYGRCYTSCPDMACIDGCQAKSPDGINEFLWLYGPAGCIYASCKTACFP
jgi:hypothetical protein